MSAFPSSRISDLNVAENFAIAFRLPATNDSSTTITVAEFDAWADRCGYYDAIAQDSTEELNSARNRVRYALNNVATGAPWRDAGYLAFNVRVYQWGLSYQIVSAAGGYVDAGQNLPRKVEGIANTRRKQLDSLLGAVDYSTLSPEIRIEVRTQMKHIDNWIERQDTEMRQMERGFRELRVMIKQESETAAHFIENHNEAFDDDD